MFWVWNYKIWNRVILTNITHWIRVQTYMKNLLTFYWFVSVEKKYNLTCCGYNRHHKSPSPFWRFSFYVRGKCTTAHRWYSNQKGIHKNYENLEEFQNKLGNFRCLLYAQHVKLSEQIRKCWPISTICILRRANKRSISCNFMHRENLFLFFF